MKHRIPGLRRSGRAALRREGVALAYARDHEGRLVSAAALTDATRRSLAPFACPGCGDELTPKLGAVRTRHFAHRPGSTCPLTSPETALHFNAKERLLVLCEEAFAGARRVDLLTRCPACRRQDARPLASLGDAAVVEGTVGPAGDLAGPGGRSLRADVLLTRRGAPTLALEVLVTHAVDAAKEAALAAASLPAIEIDARDEWERPLPDGSIELSCHRALGFPPCAACRAQARAELDRGLGGEAAEIAELEDYRARRLLEATPRGRKAGPEAPLTEPEVEGLRSRFRCPECGRHSLEGGSRIIHHRCPTLGQRPVAWRGYDGWLAELGWWKR